MSDDGSRIEAEAAKAHGEEHDDHGSHGGHGAADPNAGVLRGEAPTPAWVGAATVISLITMVVVVLVAVKIG